MATKMDDVLAEALSLTAEERERLAAKLLASVRKTPGPGAPRLLDLAGRGVGVWGHDSSATLDAQRNEWP